MHLGLINRPFVSHNLVSRYAFSFYLKKSWKGAHILGIMKEEWRSLETGHLCMRGTWREGSFTGDPKEYAK
jgi:hypothetical protein